jgi:hypothetical protein
MEEVVVVGKQTVWQRGWRSPKLQAKYRRERVETDDRRLERLAVEVLIALGERVKR